MADHHSALFLFSVGIFRRQESFPVFNFPNPNDMAEALEDPMNLRQLANRIEEQ